MVQCFFDIIASPAFSVACPAQSAMVPCPDRMARMKEEQSEHLPNSFPPPDGRCARRTGIPTLVVA